MDGYLLGIDIGGTGIKAGLFDQQGNLLHIGRRDNRILSKIPGFAEFSPFSIWENIISLIDECSIEAGVNKDAIASLGLSSTCPAVTALDKNGNPLRNVIMNFDSRSGRQVDEIHKRVDPEHIFSVTGNRLLSGAISASSILWIKENEPDIYRNTFYFGHITTYIIHRFTGRFVLDHTQASFTGLFRTCSDLDWDGELIDEYGIDRSKLPVLLSPEKAAGNISGKAASETGLGRGTCISAGAADTVCSALGAGITRPGEVFVTSGTSEILSGVLETPDFERRFMNRTYLDSRWIYHAPTSTSGAALTWLKRVFFDSDMGMDEFYRHILKNASASEIGSSGLYFLPYLQGERSPWWDSDARGVFAGLSLGTSAGDILRSVLEGIAYALKQNLDIAEENSGIEYKELLFTGGGNRNELWLNIKSDVTGKVLKVLEFEETAILGTALLGGVCAGIYRDILEASGKTGNKRFRTVSPDVNRHKQYCRYARRFKELYLALKPQFKRMKQAV